MRVMRLRLEMFFFFKQKTAYEMRISDWSSDVCSSDLVCDFERGVMHLAFAKRPGAWRFVLIDIDVEYLRCTAIAECVALVIAVAALRLQVPSIAHERVHLLIAIECGGPAVESAQRDKIGRAHV